jgi:hypothetical protein
MLSQEMPIPKSRSEGVLTFVFASIIILFAFLGMVNLCNRTALVSSSLWLVLITIILWSGSKTDGGFRKYLANRLGDLVGRRFVDAISQNAQPGEIRLGYKLLGHRVIQQIIAIEAIESIAWYTGQATDITKRDMNDWQVRLCVDHHDSDKSAKKRKLKHRKPDQDVYIIGPAMRKDLAEALGLSLVTFLRDAGAKLTQGEIPTSFIRQVQGRSDEI